MGTQNVWLFEIVGSQYVWIQNVREFEIVGTQNYGSQIGITQNLKILKICWYSKFEIVGTQKFGYSKFVGT